MPSEHAATKKLAESKKIKIKKQHRPDWVVIRPKKKGFGVYYGWLTRKRGKPTQIGKKFIVKPTIPRKPIKKPPMKVVVKPAKEWEEEVKPLEVKRIGQKWFRFERVVPHRTSFDWFARQFEEKGVETKAIDRPDGKIELWVEQKPPSKKESRELARKWVEEEREKRYKRHLKAIFPPRTVAKKILEDIKPFAKKIEIAGSIRRNKPDPKDIDIVVVPKTKESWAKIIAYGTEQDKVRLKGNKVVSFHKQGVQTDIYLANPEQYGAMLMFLTGPGGYNIGLRIIAKKKGMLLNQYGVFDRQTKRPIAGKTEKEIYNALGKVWKEPELRGK